MTGQSYISWLMATFLVVGLVGLLAIWLGVRGRRKGLEPRCRACDYNLTGLTSNRCPECGILLLRRAVVQGVRRRRPALIVAGSVLLLLGGAGIWQDVRGFDWYTLKPTAWVLSDLDDRATAKRAWTELCRRYSAGNLAEMHLRTLAARCLFEQGKPFNAQVRRPMLEWLGVLRDDNALTPAEYQQFVDQMFLCKVEAPSPVVTGDPVNVTLHLKLRAPASYVYQARVHLPSFLPPDEDPDAWQYFGTGARLGSVFKMTQNLPAPAAGQHVVYQRVVFEFRERTDGGPIIPEHEQSEIRLQAPVDVLATAPPGYVSPDPVREVSTFMDFSLGAGSGW